MNASFEEKSVWIQLLGLGAAFGIYFVLAALMLSQGILVLAAYVPLFIVTTTVLIAFFAIGHFVAFILGGKHEDADERDRVIEWRSESNSSWVLGAGAFTAMSALVVGIGDVWVAHLLMHSMFLSQVVKLAFQAFYYRRGMGS